MFLKVCARKGLLSARRPAAAASSLPAQIEPKDLNNPLVGRTGARERRERLFHLSKHLGDMMRKRMDVLAVEEGLLPKQKVVVEPLRERHRLDDFDFLRVNKEVPCVINGRGEHPPIDLVLHHTQARQLLSERIGAFQPVYVRHRGEEIRCTVDILVMSPDKSFFVRAAFNRYVVGEPNKITVELFVRLRPHLALEKHQLTWVREEVHLLSHNDNYPARMEIDFLRLARVGVFTYGDLANTLPRGLELHPCYAGMLHLAIARLEPLENKKELDAIHRLKMAMPTNRELRRLRDIDTGKIVQEVGVAELTPKKKAEGAQRPKLGMSLKKRILADQDKLKKKLESHMAVEAKKPEGKKR